MQNTHQELQVEQWKLSNLRNIGEKELGDGIEWVNICYKFQNVSRDREYLKKLPGFYLKVMNIQDVE